MPDWPRAVNRGEFEPPFLTNAPIWRAFSGQQPLHSSAVWHANNGVIYTPVYLRRRMLIKKLYAFNGATVSGNCCIALYASAYYGGAAPSAFGYSALSIPYTRLATSGSVGQSGTNAWQTFNITDVLLDPGLYWLAYALDNTTGTVMRLASIAVPASSNYGWRFAPFRQGGGYPPPDPASPGYLSSGDTYSVPLLAMGGLA